MNDSINAVQRHYDSNPQYEWDRFTRYRFEFPVKMHLLRKYLKPESRILDAGGGPGRYAIELTRLGHRVDLFDLSPENISYAGKMAEKNNIKLNGYHVGNAVDLAQFSDDMFDAALLFGTLYHLTDEADRKNTILEAIRVLKKEGLLAAAFISSYSNVFDVINKDPARISDGTDLLLKCGTSNSFTASNDKTFTDAFYIEPFEIESYMKQFPLKQLTIIGAEGLLSQSQNRICDYGEDIIRKWIDFTIATADTKGAIGSSIHVTYFGKKNK